MRLIDADALHNSLRNKQKWVVRSFYGKKYNEGYTYDQVHFAIDDAPTADAVEVVRCKDCKWFGDLGCAIRIVDDSDKPTENDYCSFAERRSE